MTTRWESEEEFRLHIKEGDLIVIHNDYHDRIVVALEPEDMRQSRNIDTGTYAIFLNEFHIIEHRKEHAFYKKARAKVLVGNLVGWTTVKNIRKPNNE